MSTLHNRMSVDYDGDLESMDGSSHSQNPIFSGLGMVPERGDIEMGTFNNNNTTAKYLNSMTAAQREGLKAKFVKAHKARMRVGSKRWDKDNADAVRVMNCKINMFKVLDKVANMRANYRIQRFLYIFQEACQQGEVIIDADGKVKEKYWIAFEEVRERAFLPSHS